MENKIDHQTATEEFERFCEDWEIDCDTAGMNEEEKADFESLKSKLVNAIKKGRMVFDNGKLVYTISNKSGDMAGKEISIVRPRGESYMEMDRYKDREGVHKTYAILANMTGQTPAFFARLDGIDLKPFMAVVQLFLAS